MPLKKVLENPLVFFFMLMVIVGFVSGEKPLTVLGITVLFWIGFGVATLLNELWEGSRKLMQAKGLRLVKIFAQAFIYGPYTYRIL